MVLREGPSKVSPSEVSKGRISLKDLFPSTEGDPTEKQLHVLGLSQRIGVPFPVEPNPKYANWWHSLHEVAHWAVKPDWYIAPTAGARTIPIYTADLPVSNHDSNFGRDTVPIRYYRAGNDVLPNMGMYIDPTPSENEVRAWSVLTMHKEGLEHPFRSLLRERIDPQSMREHGDDGWHKIATAKVWSPVTPTDPLTIAKMAEYGINPLVDDFRAKDNGFYLPYQVIDSLSALQENFDAIDLQHGQRALRPPSVPEAKELGREYWNVYSTWASFIGRDTPDSVYDDLLSRFDHVSERSIQAFERAYAACINEGSSDRISPGVVFISNASG